MAKAGQTQKFGALRACKLARQTKRVECRSALNIFAIHDTRSAPSVDPDERHQATQSYSTRAQVSLQDSAILPRALNSVLSVGNPLRSLLAIYLEREFTWRL